MSFTVLIADDEAMPRTVLKEHIPWEELSVTQVHLATDGEEAVEQARRFRPEIIISDIKMPRRNGLEMAAAVREFLPACQFIFLSGYSDKEYLKGAIRLRAACYVEKPLDLSEITAALREVTAELLRHAQPTEEELFFHGGHSPERPMNQTVFSCGKSALSQLEKLIRSNRGEETLAALGRMYAEISRCEGTSPEYLRHLYCQIIFLFLHAAESHNVRAVTERTDFLLYTAVRQETLAGLWDILRRTAQDYFSALNPSCPDIAVRVEESTSRPITATAVSPSRASPGTGFTWLIPAPHTKKLRQNGQPAFNGNTPAPCEGASCRNQPQALRDINAVGYGDGKYFVKLFTGRWGFRPGVQGGIHMKNSLPAVAAVVHLLRSCAASCSVFISCLSSSRWDVFPLCLSSRGRYPGADLLGRAECL